MKSRRSYCKLYYHIVFATKRRVAVLDKQMLQRVLRSIEEKAKKLGIEILCQNGHENHVHILCRLGPSKSVSEIVKQLKGYSSFTITEIQWQLGFSAFTVEEQNLPELISYIQNQENHHGKGD